MTPRADVYAALDSERDYQDQRWGPTESQGLHSIEEFILYMEDYLAEAKHLLARAAQADAYPAALANMRKVTAMGVACMEQHGAPLRKIQPEWRINEKHAHDRNS